MNPLSWFGPDVSTALSLMLLHSLWQVSLVVVLLWCVDRAWRPRVERVYALHVAGLLLCLVALPATFAVLYSPPVSPPPAPLPVNGGSMEMATEDALQSEPMTPESGPPMRASVASNFDVPAVTSSDAARANSTNWVTIAAWVSAAYLLGVVLMLLRLVRSIYRAERLRAHSKPITAGPLAESLVRLTRKLALRLRCTLASSCEVVVPTVVGFVKPTILLPASALTGLSASELEMILVHELAHVRRYDLWVNLVQRLAEVVLFFNPALWYLSRKIAALREYCCDELTCRQVATTSEEPRVEYATTLLRVVELARPTTPTADLAALAATGRTPSELRRRVARLFGEPLTEPVRLSRGAIWLVGVALVVCCGVLAQSQDSDLNKNVADGKSDTPNVAAEDDKADEVDSTTPAQPKADAERIKYLQQMAETYRNEQEFIDMQVRAGERPQHERVLAQYQLSRALAELAAARDKPEEVVKNYREAVEAAERLLAMHETLYNSGVISMDTVLIAQRRLAEAKELLRGVESALAAANNESDVIPSTNVNQDTQEPDASRIKYLKELTESYRKEVELVEMQSRMGEKTQRDVILARYALAVAEANLADAQGASLEAVRHQSEAVAAAQTNVEALELMYQENGTATYEQVLQAKRQLIEAKEALRLAERSLESKDDNKSSRTAPAVPILCVDADGNGVPAAEVYLFQHSGGDEGVYQQFGPFTTDDQGRAECDEVLFTSDAGNYDRFYYARVPGKLVGVSRSANWKSRDPVNADGRIEMRPSRTINGRVNVPEGFDPTSVKVVVRTMNVRTGPEQFDYQGFPRYRPFITLDTALSGTFERRPNADGTFRLHDVPIGGGLYLATEADGLAEAQWYTYNGQYDDPIELDCVKEGVLTGQVTTPVGSPAAGIEVAARIHSGRSRKVGHETTFRTVTDDEGRYKLRGLPEWDLVISVDDPEHRWIACPSEPFFLSPDSSETLDLQLENGVTVSGRVTDTAGAPVEGAHVSALVDNDAGSGVANMSTDEDGKYTLRMPSGSFRLYFSGVPPEFVYPDPQVIKRLTINAEQQPIADLNFTLDRKEEKQETTNEDQDSQQVRDTREDSKALLDVMALVEGYGLEEGQLVGRVAPPFEPIRAEYYRMGHPTQADAISEPPTAMTFHWDGEKLTNWGMSFGDREDPGYSLTGLMDALVKIKSQEIDGPGELLDKPLAGDWVIRPDADKYKVVAQLEKILRNQFDMKVKLEFREVEREVYVASGRYHFSPLEGQPGEDVTQLIDRRRSTDPIQIFGKQMVPNSGAGGGSGDFDDMLDWVGRWIGTPIVNELEVPTERQVSWRLHERSPFTEEMQRQDHDPVAVLRNVSRQTGLEFTKGTRKVEVLFVVPE